ncbi:hypothetical protein POL68_42085 [Stigmatella sp. ncwal1]|uniref:Uncharacterized protein n=1 Tax=Stigmatella ashevillensis TaxID=2995309 RepID=A0ABT5DQY2_9BACT|nr:hypothetical protein [Stigmatella ashevillena]MDC0715113.1 hypothetical protein [Stigmatella ashevillena]
MRSKSDRAAAMLLIHQSGTSGQIDVNYFLAGPHSFPSTTVNVSSEPDFWMAYVWYWGNNTREGMEDSALWSYGYFWSRWWVGCNMGDTRNESGLAYVDRTNDATPWFWIASRSSEAKEDARLIERPGDKCFVSVKNTTGSTLHVFIVIRDIMSASYPTALVAANLGSSETASESEVAVKRSKNGMYVQIWAIDADGWFSLIWNSGNFDHCDRTDGEEPTHLKFIIANDGVHVEVDVKRKKLGALKRINSGKTPIFMTGFQYL